jgi:hypothetical protein
LASTGKGVEKVLTFFKERLFEVAPFLFACGKSSIVDQVRSRAPILAHPLSGLSMSELLGCKEVFASLAVLGVFRVKPGFLSAHPQSSAGFLPRRQAPPSPSSRLF